MTQDTVKKSLSTRIAIYGFGAVLFASCTVGGLAWWRQSEMSEQSFEAELASDYGYLQADMKAQQRAASALALAVAGEPDIAGLIQSNARDALLARYGSSFDSIIENGSLQLITFTNANGFAVARIHSAENFGDDLKPRRKTVATALATGRLTAGIEPGRTAVSIFASAPVTGVGGVAGVVDVGTSLTEDYFARLADDIGAEIAVHILKDGVFEQQASTFADNPLLSPEELTAALSGATDRRETQTGDQSFAVSGFPLANFSGETIGVIEMASDVTALVQARQAALSSTIIGSVVVSGIALLAFLLFARSLATVLRRLTSTMSRLAGGDLTTEVVGQERQDEIGAMARAVEVLKRAATENLRLEAEAGAAREAQSDQNRRLAEIENSKAEDLRAFVHAVDDGFNALSTGDLTVRITSAVAPEFEPIRARFNESVAKLEDAIASVVSAVGTIRVGLDEISVASDDLAQRTEEQAASLEETVAALSEVTGAVNETANGAAQAQGAALNAQKNAEKGGEIVGRAVAAMSEIERSSDKIGKIIGVIDEIAFQTNLLALNAGVEAARAGEAGRGFAVVAQEVRGLAQRSADAAKEIKELISTSGVQVERGVELVKISGKSLDEIVAQVGEVCAVVSRIASGAREQAISLKEVSTAADRMDKVTQQNAAMVEETTAAAQTLSRETEELAAMVTRFKAKPLSQGAMSGAQPRGSAQAPRGVVQLRTVGGGGAAPRNQPAGQ